MPGKRTNEYDDHLFCVEGDQEKENSMSDPKTTVDANHLVNDAITSFQNEDVAQGNSQLEEAAQIYEQNGADGDAQDARDLIQGE